MKVFDDVLKFLRDSEWHSFQEIQEKTGLTTFKTALLVNFLVSYGFCDYLKGTATIIAVKLKDDIIQFLENLEKIEANMERLKNV